MKKNILIIENDEYLANIYNKKLTGDGFNAVIARDGNSGLRAATKSPPDLIILDLLLPRKPGVEVLKELKADGNLKMIPVIISSDLSEKEMINECFRLGAVDFIIKAHINLSELSLRVKRALNQ
ncbi:MAG: response regulator [Patescibacteria group bacterium]